VVVGGDPRRITFNRAGTRAYVANLAGQIDVIQ
jgi:DNA-binding beta-propeller fold protein YncE